MLSREKTSALQRRVFKEWHLLVQKGKVCFLMSNCEAPLPNVLYVGTEFNFCTLTSQYLKGYLLLGMCRGGSAIRVPGESIRLKQCHLAKSCRTRKGHIC